MLIKHTVELNVWLMFTETMKRYVLLLLFHFYSCIQASSLQMEVIKDLLSQFHRANVIFKNCGDYEERLEFYNIISATTESSGFSNSIMQDQSSGHRAVIVMDLSCHDFSREIISSNKFKWILFYSKAVNESVSDLQISVPLTNSVFQILDDMNEYTIWKLSKLSSSYQKTKKIYGFWRLDSFPHLQINATPYNDHWNLQGTHLKASIVCPRSGIDSSTKVNKALTIALAQLLNASITFHCTPDWTKGLLNDLRTRSSDLGATPSYMTPERIKLVQFLAMTGPLDYKFIFRSPKLSYTDNVFILSFHHHVWLSIGGIVLLAAALQLIISRFDHPSESADDPRGQIGPGEVLLSMIGIASQQESLVDLRSVSSRTMNIVMLISLMFLYISYSANIVAVIQSPSTRVRTLGDLMGWKFDLTAQDSAVNRIFMANDSDPLRRNVYAKIVNSNGFLPVANGTERIRHGLAAFHGDTNEIYRYMVEHYDEDEKCNLQEINLLPPLHGYYTVAKDSPLAEHIKYGLLKLHELGFLQRHIALHYQRKPPCIGDSLFVPVSMIDAIFSLQLMGWAVALAIVGLALEITWQRYNVQLRSLLGGFNGKSRKNKQH